MDINRKIIDLKAERADMLTKAETAMEAGNEADYASALEAVQNMGNEIAKMEALLAEQRRFALDNPAEPQDTQMLTERGKALMAGESVTFSVGEVHQMLLGHEPQNSTAPSTTTIAPPTGARNLRDNIGMVSSILDQVHVENLMGTGGINEVYVKTGITATSGTLEARSGKTPTPSDPTYRMAAIKPYAIDTTSYLDARLTAVAPNIYEAKIRALAGRALRAKAVQHILLGDGAATPTMFGFTTAKNTDSEEIYTTKDIGSAIAVNTLNLLYYSYGADTEIGGAARLFLNRKDLEAFGEIRGTNEKRALFDITPDEGNPNTGTIKSGGMIVPYTICDGLSAFADAAAGSNTMVYGNPLAYTLGMFSDFTVRVDASYKAGERLLTIMGDAVIGGNLVVDRSMVVATKAAASGG